MTIKHTLSVAIVSAIAVTSLYSGPINAARQPTLNLFPTNLKENLQSSADSAKAMEDSMESIVAQMDKQMSLYKDSKCDDNSIDAGCTQIKRGISKTYNQMLEKMEEHLPAMKQSMQATVTSLQHNIRNQLGKKMTPRDLQQVAQGKKGSITPKQPGKRQGRMSSKLRQLYQMITLNTNNHNPAIYAAEIYADTAEALEYINLIQAEISNSKQIDPYSFYEPSAQMEGIVSNVKTLLFGEAEGDGFIPETPFVEVTPVDGGNDWIIE